MKKLIFSFVLLTSCEIRNVYEGDIVIQATDNGHRHMMYKCSNNPGGFQATFYAAPYLYKVGDTIKFKK